MKPLGLLITAAAFVLGSCSMSTAPLPQEQRDSTSIAAPSTSVPATVDRRNPESVLRAYFDAWARSDWSTQVSFMDQKYAQLTPEPVDSMRLVDVALISTPSSNERTYRVIFEIRVKGQGVTMQSGRYDWTYYLTWDAERNSWLITNYGAG